MSRMAMTLRLSPDDEQALALLAEADGVSKQEATVRAIHETASRRRRQDKIRTGPHQTAIRRSIGPCSVPPSSARSNH
jgi:predicted transcriptional regulator